MALESTSGQKRMASFEEKASPEGGGQNLRGKRWGRLGDKDLHPKHPGGNVFGKKRSSNYLNQKGEGFASRGGSDIRRSQLSDPVTARKKQAHLATTKKGESM